MINNRQTRQERILKRRFKRKKRYKNELIDRVWRTSNLWAKLPSFQSNGEVSLLGTTATEVGDSGPPTENETDLDG